LSHCIAAPAATPTGGRVRCLRVGRQPAVVEREPQREVKQERDARPLDRRGQHRPARERGVHAEADQQEQRDETERRAGRLAGSRQDRGVRPR
jgi:hypothetical protein